MGPDQRERDNTESCNMPTAKEALRRSTRVVKRKEYPDFVLITPQMVNVTTRRSQRRRTIAKKARRVELRRKKETYHHNREEARKVNEERYNYVYLNNLFIERRL